MRKKIKITFTELIQKNKEELLKDKSFIEKIEKRVDEKISNSK